MATTTTTTIHMTRAQLDGRRLQCPGRSVGDYPRKLTFITTGNVVHATCGERHRVPGTGPKAKCFWVVEGMTPAVVKTLADQKPGRIRAELPTGKSFEGKLLSVSGPKASKAAAAHGEKSKDGKGSSTVAVPAPHAARNQSGGGTAKAAFVAITAIAGAATAAANAVGRGADAAGKAFDMGREGFRTGQVVAKEVGNADARRFAERNATAPAAKPTRRRRKKADPS